MVGDWTRDHWYPTVPRSPIDSAWPDPNHISREEFDRLKKELEGIKKLLEMAKKYDVDNNQPDCEIEDKIAWIKKTMQMFGIDTSDLLK